MQQTSQRNANVVLVCGGIILSLALGIRHTFGLFLPPMSAAHGWGREVFALAIAVQNLLMGAVQPWVGMWADRFGAGRVVVIGAAIYVLGLLGMSWAGTPWALQIATGGLLGLALSATTFTVVLGAVVQVVPVARRSFAMGLTSAFGSVGQFVMLPLAMWGITYGGWQMALWGLALLALVMLPLAKHLPRAAPRAQAGSRAGMALRTAWQTRDFKLLCFGYFVCGFHVLFVATHLPAFLLDQGLSATVGTTVLALVGLFNIAGSFTAGWLGGRYAKPYLLAGLYASRALVIVLFAFILPVTTWSAYGFGMLMGFLWLSTVPLTNGTIASRFGTEHLSMLGGVAFFFHQLGAFLGGWLGGLWYDRAGNYTGIWSLSVALAVVAALANVPIREYLPQAKEQPPC